MFFHTLFTRAALLTAVSLARLCPVFQAVYRRPVESLGQICVGLSSTANGSIERRAGSQPARESEMHAQFMVPLHWYRTLLAPSSVLENARGWEKVTLPVRCSPCLNINPKQAQGSAWAHPVPSTPIHGPIRSTNAYTRRAPSWVFSRKESVPMVFRRFR